MGEITNKWVKLLVPITRGRPLTQSELSRITGIPQQTASRTLNILSTQGLLSYERQGKNKLYEFNKEHPATATLLQLIEKQKALEFLLEQEAAIIIQELLLAAETIILFGSYARQEAHKDSDLDLIILGKADRNKINTITQRTGMTINIQYTTNKELKQAVKNKNPLAIEIIQDHILFGNTDETTTILTTK